MTPQIRIGNAPCSWGTLEFTETAAERIGYARMLDELRETGYVGTELGDWGFMPTEPAALRAELTGRGLAMIGAFVSAALSDPSAHADGAARAVRTARLLAAVAEAGAEPRPWVILADANGIDPAREANAGRVTPALGLDADRWRTFAGGAERLARAVRDETGLATAFHHHSGGYVETPDEIARLLDLTDPDLLGLVFDTGHYAYGAGGDGAAVPDGLRRCGDRVRHVHVKDCDPVIAAEARASDRPYTEAVRRGVFCELGRGGVDFPDVLAWLRARDYRGWIVDRRGCHGLARSTES